MISDSPRLTPRLVLDTNVVVAGLLWNGPPRQLLDLTIGGAVALYSTGFLLDELAHTLAYSKFAARIQNFGATREALVAEYTALITRVSPVTMPRISRDPDDDHVIACALAAHAEMVVSGDKDLRVLREYHGIRIVSAREALNLIALRQS